MHIKTKHDINLTWLKNVLKKGKKEQFMGVCRMSAQNGETDKRFENYRQL